ncbi:hypothetical protein P280DRAFT_464681 [Massarina eburnea CBS 473.64]|uniref:Uncharacterized protein n=1 Tax=Massarina eburnea CBS 473.64 TaxID=1395130 RepID=A0A6A6SHQ4_9PLEO|nr:hypothetical protein P280DRAFT_464681 [Massarina eburnea CBS 473.64]
MAAPVLSTLHHVTERKLNKLAHHREKFEADKKAILAKAASASNPRAGVEALLEGFELHGITPKSDDIFLENMERFVHQAKHDLSVSPTLLRDWQLKLEHELDVASVKYEYAALFGKLVIEWINEPNPAASTIGGYSESNSSGVSVKSDSFDATGRKEMYEQRREWEGYAFIERKVDQAKIAAYLDDIFGVTMQAKKVKKTPLRNLQDSMKAVMDFKSDLQTPKRKLDRHDKLIVAPEVRFTVDKLKSCIRGLLQMDFFDGKKREALADLSSQPAVLTELVDVLNMDLDDLDHWTWDPSPVPLNMRRQLNGKYRVYMDEETHQAILLHFIGKTWAVALKQAFNAFYHSGAWLQTPYRPIGQMARQRRDYFIPATTSDTVRNFRRRQYQEEYFMTQLPGSAFDDRPDYDAEGQNEPSSPLKTPHATKQALLRLVTTEMLLNTKVYGDFLVIQSDFKWFGPSLPHDTISAVLKFFGVPGKWLRFFKKFLEAPVAFAQDGPGAEAQVRKCGIPMSHVLSDALSETVLFCLDFAVNKRTKGANIHRFHDDLWIWGQEATCQQAWDAMQEFTAIMGLQLKEEKTGSALIVANKANARDLPATLPRGQIKWGFLTLDADAGRWVIDRSQVDEHISELRRQLEACRSVMAWVQAWNSYVSRFFATNFGQPANCFGRQHNDMIIDTFAYIQRSLFVDTGTANATDHLRGMLKDRFGTDDSVPDGFFYFPVEFGGLGLRNPLIDAFATYKKSLKSSSERIDRAFEEEQEEYEKLKESWDNGDTKPSIQSRAAYKRMKSSVFPKEDSATDTEADEAFMTLDEFTSYREDVSAHLHRAYTNLLEAPTEEYVAASSDFLSAIRNNSSTAVDLDTPYWRWVFSLYAGDMKQKFGGHGLQLGERDMLPVGLVDVLKSEKVRWEG